MATLGNLPRISSSDLSTILLAQSAQQPDPTIAIIDVRDEDHIGGHIRGSTHVPSQSLDHAIPSLVHKLKDKETVVFHCALSLERGPKAALRYLRARERLLGSSTTTVGEALKKSATGNRKGVEIGEEAGDGDWKDTEEEETKKTQKVYVLDKGFSGWQALHGEDNRLTEGYSRELWSDTDS